MSGLSSDDWFADLYRRRYEAVYAYGARRIGSEAAADLAAEVFLVLWRRGIRLTDEEERPWLFGTARKVMANLLRSQRRYETFLRRTSTVVAAEVNRQLDPMAAADASVDVRAALAKLPANDHEALLLVEWDDVDLATGAAIAGCSVGAFKVRVHRARRRLTELLVAAGRPDVLIEKR